MTDVVEVKERLGVARIAAANVWPWWTEGLWRLSWVVRPGVGTVAVDKHWRCYADPDWTLKQRPEHLAGALAHEVQHLVRGHHRRGIDNIPGDLALNDDPELFRTLPPGCLHPSQYGFPVGLCEEEYAELLRQRQDARGGNHPTGAGEGDGEPQPANTGAGDCGSCADGVPRHWEDDAPKDSDFDSVSEVEEQMIAQRAADQPS